MFPTIFLNRFSQLRRSGGRQWSSNWIFIALLLLTTALAAVLRLYRLDVRGLWADEIFTAIFASAENDLATVAQRPLSAPIPAPPLWFFITHFFIKALGNNEIAVRLPSVIAGVLGILASYKVGETLFGRVIGLISALLLAVSPFNLRYSQEGRCYAGVVFFSLLTLYFLHRGMNSDEKRWWVGFTIATVVNLYTHLTAFLVLAVEILYASLLMIHDLLVARRATCAKNLTHTSVWPALASLCTIAACYVPMVSYLLTGIQGPRGLGNSSNIPGLRLSVRSFLTLFGDFGAGAGIPLSLYMAAFLQGLINAVRKQGRQGLLILLWTAAPFAIVLFLHPKHWFVPKYVISILPIYLMTVSAGITCLARSIALFLSSWNPHRLSKLLPALSLVSLAALYSVLAVLALGQVYAQQQGRWREIGQFFANNRQPEDAVASFPISSVLLTMPGREIMAYYGPRDLIEVGSRDQLEDLLAYHRRVWIVIPGQWAEPLSEFRSSLLVGQPYLKLSIRDEASVLYTGKDQTLLSLLEEAEHFTNLTAETHGSIGEAYGSMRMWEEALAAYIRSVEMEPDRSIWHYYLGTLYERTGQRDRALAEYERAVHLQPEIPGFHAALGDFYRQAGRADEAILEYRQAIRLYTSQNRGAENSKYVRSWNNIIHEIETSVERAGARDNAFFRLNPSTR
jgi:tetratricopeptide (TPR) repeat protein